jgi:hypothetical protein
MYTLHSQMHRIVGMYLLGKQIECICHLPFANVAIGPFMIQISDHLPYFECNRVLLPPYKLIQPARHPPDSINHRIRQTLRVQLVEIELLFRLIFPCGNVCGNLIFPTYATN